MDYDNLCVEGYFITKGLSCICNPLEVSITEEDFSKRPPGEVWAENTSEGTKFRFYLGNRSGIDNRLNALISDGLRRLVLCFESALSTLLFLWESISID